MEWLGVVFVSVLVFHLIVFGEGVTSRSKDLCRKFSEGACDSSPESNAAVPREFQHAALLGHQDDGSEKIEWRCGGSLISDRHVLTAGVCVGDKNNTSLRVRLGEFDRLSHQDEAEGRANATDYPVARVHLHPAYNASALTYHGIHDVAVLELSEPVHFDRFVRPICLQGGRDFNPENARVASWDLDYYRKSGNLHKRHVKIVSNEVCNKAYKKNDSHDGIDEDYVVCALDLDPIEGCESGDSGSALHVPNPEFPCAFSQVGLVSFGMSSNSHECPPNAPIGYTRISAHLPWIESLL